MTIGTIVLLAAQTIHYPGELPDMHHAWCVHDPNRPNPVKVTAEVGKPPSDAIILFDGTQESVVKNWCDKDGNPTKWKSSNGELVCVPGSGYIFTKRKFGDCQLHIEWKAPADEPGMGQGRGNSGVFLQDEYEIQVLESFGTDPKHMTNPNYADGQASAVYGQHPPLVNPARKEGEWQTYDIVFHPAVWHNHKQIHRPTMTCFFNGVLVHDQWELDGPTDWLVRSKATELPPLGPLSLQDHGHPVPFRNIWIRKIPSRWADKVHGGCGMQPMEVAKQRVRNAARLSRKVQKGVYTYANAERAMQVVAYDPDGGYRARMYEICDGLAAKIDKLDAKALENPDERDDMLCIKRLVKLMVDRKFMKPGTPLEKACAEAEKRIPKK